MTIKTLKRVRFNRADYAVEPKIKTEKDHPGSVNRDFKLPYYRRMAMNMYVGLYQGKFSRSPFNAFIQKQITRTVQGKSNAKYIRFIKLFDDISNFLLNLREEQSAVNQMRDLFRDYFNCVLDHYGQYNRIPNMNQLGPGPVNSQNFLQYATQEEHFGLGYWMEQKHIDAAEDIRRNPDKYKRDDPLMDLTRLREGFEPMWRKNRTLSPNGEIVEDGIVKIYSPIGKLLESRPL